jgi:hypothetical protein
LSEQFPWPPTATGTQQLGINHFYSSIWTQQTALYGQGRVSLVRWCRAGFGFQQNLAQKISDGSQLLSAQFPWPPTATGTSQTGINPFYSLIWIQQTALHVQGRVSLALWYRAGFGFQQNLGQKSAVMDDPSCCQHNFLGHQQGQGQGHNKQESTTFILPYGSNKQHCMGKEEIHWLLGVVQGWFSAKLG